jgi:hypothetical protein
VLPRVVAPTTDIENTLPTRTDPAQLTEEPTRAKPLNERALPSWRLSRTDARLPKRTVLLTERLLLISRHVCIETVDPKRHRPVAESPDPILAKLLVLRELPSAKHPKTLTRVLVRAVPKSESELPARM